MSLQMPLETLGVTSKLLAQSSISEANFFLYKISLSLSLF